MNSGICEPPLQQIAADLFRDFNGDEAGGRHAIRGFSFQIWHAVLEALRAHRLDDDYAIVLEWQQDVAVLDSSTAPKNVRFIQLKKRESSTHWKLAQLIQAADQADDQSSELTVTGVGADDSSAEPSSAGSAAKKIKPKKVKPKQSILAKMYTHRRRFKALTSCRLEFASDAEFQVPDSTGKHVMYESFELANLPPAIKVDVEAKLRAQLEIESAEAVDLSNFALVVSDCPVSEAYKYLVGELAEMSLNAEFKLSSSATFLAILIIASYINLRAGKRSFAKNFDELLERAVTRNDITKYLAAADEQTVSAQDIVASLLPRLTFEGASYHLVKHMRHELVRACAEITNRAGRVPVIAAYLKALYVLNSEYATIPKLVDILSAWHNDFEKLHLNEARDYSREYIYCLMSMIAEDANPTKHLPSVSLGPEFKDGK